MGSSGPFQFVDTLHVVVITSFDMHDPFTPLYDNFGIQWQMSPNFKYNHSFVILPSHYKDEPMYS